MDLESLLSPLAGDQPSGVELRNDARFHAIERLIEPASRQNRVKPDGSINESAPPVDWNAVLSQGEELAAEGRDLRLLVILVRGVYATEGFRGLSQGIALLQRSLADFWDSLHPGLRARDDPQMAAMARSNALRQLENEDNGLLGDLRYGIAFSPRGIGPITLNDVAALPLSDFEVQAKMPSGLGQAEKDAILARHHDRAKRARSACRAMAVEQRDDVAAMVAEMGACLAGLAALGTEYAEKGGLDAASGLGLKDLPDFLANCRKSLETALAESETETSGAAPVAPVPVQSPGTSAQIPVAVGNAAVNSAPVKAGEINSRADVEVALDRIVAFYERTEPSSPIPHVARRLRKMVAMDFLQLMTEIAPSGLKEFRNIAGLDENKK